MCPNSVLCFTYKLPPHKPHEPRLMEGTIPEPPILTEMDKPIVSGEIHNYGPVAQGLARPTDMVEAGRVPGARVGDSVVVSAWHQRAPWHVKVASRIH